ncbi:MAG: hypothetical protein VYB66_09225, partial [Verrucomicrobiota bacterium]|nr:hypothetical protein [Verrucomicrobiota bacterium]
MGFHQIQLRHWSKILIVLGQVAGSNRCRNGPRFVLIHGTKRHSLPIYIYLNHRLEMEQPPTPRPNQRIPLTNRFSQGLDQGLTAQLPTSRIHADEKHGTILDSSLGQGLINRLALDFDRATGT